jgi:hypothetical protein
MRVLRTLLLLASVGGTLAGCYYYPGYGYGPPPGYGYGPPPAYGYGPPPGPGYGYGGPNVSLGFGYYGGGGCCYGGGWHHHSYW